MARRRPLTHAVGPLRCHRLAPGSRTQGRWRAPYRRSVPVCGDRSPPGQPAKHRVIVVQHRVNPQPPHPQPFQPLTPLHPPHPRSTPGHPLSTGSPTVQQRVTPRSATGHARSLPGHLEFTNGSPRLPQTALPTPENVPNRPESAPRNTVSAPRIFAPTRSPALPPPNTRTPTAAQNPANQRHFRAPRHRYPKTTSAPLLTSGADVCTFYKLPIRAVSRSGFVGSESETAKERRSETAKERNGEGAKERNGETARRRTEARGSRSLRSAGACVVGLLRVVVASADWWLHGLRRRAARPTSRSSFGGLRRSAAHGHTDTRASALRVGIVAPRTAGGRLARSPRTSCSMFFRGRLSPKPMPVGCAEYDR
jgi:hypothetical protein